jgi:hypothetical protein
MRRSALLAHVPDVPRNGCRAMTNPDLQALEAEALERRIQYAYARWAIDNEPASFPAPHVIERTSFEAGYRAAVRAMIAARPRGEG